MAVKSTPTPTSIPTEIIKKVYLSDVRTMLLFNCIWNMASNEECPTNMINKVMKSTINESKKILDFARIMREMEIRLSELDKKRIEQLSEVHIIKQLEIVLNHVLHNLLKDVEKVEDDKTNVYWKSTKRLIVESKQDKTKNKSKSKSKSKSTAKKRKK